MSYGDLFLIAGGSNSVCIFGAQSPEGSNVSITVKTLDTAEQAITRHEDLARTIIDQRDRYRSLREANAARVRAAGQYGSRSTGGGLVAARPGQRRRA